MKRQKIFFPSLPPYPSKDKSTTLRISHGMDPTLFAHASTITFLFARSSPPNDLLQQPARKNEPDRNFFFGHTLLDSTDRTLPRIPMLPVNSVLPGSFSHPMLPKSSVTYAFQPASLDLSLSSLKKISFGLLSFTTRSNSFGEHFCVTSTSPSPTHPPNGKNHFSAALHSSSLRSVYIITTQFFVLRSSFCFFLGISKTDPYHSCPPPPCRTVFHSCVRAVGVLVWFGFRQSGSIDCSLFPSPVLYYLHITGDSVY